MLRSSVLAVLVGCAPAGERATRPGADGTMPDLQDVFGGLPYVSPSEPTMAKAGPSPQTPTVLQVEVEDPGTWHVEYGKEDYDSVTPESTGRAVDLRGLEADTAYRWRVVGTDADGVPRVSPDQWYVVPPAPAVFPQIHLEVEGDPGFRYLLATMELNSPAERAATVILDTQGHYVWWVMGDVGIDFVTPQLTTQDGEPVVGWVQADHALEDDVAKLVHVPISGAWRKDTRLPMGHHDVVEHEDGRLAFLAETFRYRWLGRGWAHMVSDQIRIGEVGQQDGDPTDLLFDMFDDFPIRPHDTCWHIDNVETTFGVEGVQEWTHANSLLYVPEDDAYVVNDKYTDWMFEVDAQSGRVLWVMNGLHGNFTNPDGTEIWRSPSDTDLWSHAHTSEVWHGGAMMFDNGDHREPPSSRVTEIAWDDEAHTAQTVWVYDHPEHGFTQALGDAHKLPDDRVLVTWAALGTVEVVERDHTVDWRLRIGNGGWIGRVLPLESLYQL